jgi:hypothetical protein
LHDFIYKTISTVEKYSTGKCVSKEKNVKMSKPQFLHFSTGSQYCLKIFHYSLLGMGEEVGREGTLSQVLASFVLPCSPIRSVWKRRNTLSIFRAR